MIRVLNVMEDGRIAGPQLRMLRVAKCLENEVETVIAIPNSGSTEFKDALETADANYIQLPLTKLSRNPKEILKSLIMMPSEIWCLVSAVKSRKIDVVHSSGGAWMFKAIIAARIANVPSVWHLNDTSSPALFRWLARFLLKHFVSGVIVAGSRVKEHYLPDYDARYKKKLFLLSIEAPVNTKLFVPKENAVPKEGSNKIRIITVGNISPVKDYMTVVRAANHLVSKQKLEWFVIGSSYDSQKRYKQALDEEIARLNIDLLKFLGPSDDIVGHLNNADIYVCSSAAEASPTSVWEAMACGLPVVSTDVGCVRDYVKEGIGGFLVEPGDSEKIADRIESLIVNDALRKSMGEANRMTATSALDISVCAQRHKKMYECSVEQHQLRRVVN